MPHKMQSDSQFLSVTTKGLVSDQERASILTNITNMSQITPLEVVIIDHGDAKFEMNLSAGAELGRQLIRIRLHNSTSKIFVISSLENRQFIDVAVMIGITSGLPIKVCESRSEVIKNMMGRAVYENLIRSIIWQ